MLAGTETIATIAEHWLAQFEDALANATTSCSRPCFILIAIGAMCWP